MGYVVLDLGAWGLHYKVRVLDLGYGLGGKDLGFTAGFWTRAFRLGVEGFAFKVQGLARQFSHWSHASQHVHMLSPKY